MPKARGKVRVKTVTLTEATPNGYFEFTLSNPKLLGQFKPGQQYYLDLTPVEE